MKYDITKPTAPKMPRLGKGTECISLIASQVSPDMREAIVPMLFPALGAYMSNSEFQYPDYTWKEITGQLAHIVADSGMGKGQLTKCIETIMRKRKEHDDEELEKLVEWQKTTKKRGANKEKPERPDVALLFPPCDVTNPAFLQNATSPASACSCSSGRCCPRWFTISCRPTARTSATTILPVSERRPTMNEFTIRAYSKKELALMYFPDSTPRTAVSHLMSWLRRCTPLWQQLLVTGYDTNSKAFTPRQVRVIVEQLGEP